MASVSMSRSGRPTLTVGANRNLMQILLAAGVPVASSCNGDGICAKCKVSITSGQEFLNELTAEEKSHQERGDLPLDLRLACQCEVNGDVDVHAPYW